MSSGTAWIGARVCSGISMSRSGRTRGRHARLGTAILLAGCALVAWTRPGTAADPGWGRSDASRPPADWMVLTPAFRIVPPDIAETSGIVRSGGAFFVHNDSGDTARLFRSRRLDFADAQDLPLAGAEAVDWEEITTYRGDLLICDTGDNGRTRHDVMLYRAAYVPGSGEHSASPGRLVLKERYPVRYQDGPHDVEAAFTLGDHVYLVTKDRGEGTWVLRFSELRDIAELPAGGANVPTPVGQLDLGGEQVTAGAHDPRHHVVYLLTYSGIAVYPDQRLQGAPAQLTRTWARQAEAICVQGDSLIFANEQRDVFVVEKFLDRARGEALPPRHEAGLAIRDVPFWIDGDASEWASEATSVPLADARPGESLRWLVSQDRLLLSGRFRSEVPFAPSLAESLRARSGVLLSFAPDEPRATFLDGTERQIFFGATADGPSMSPVISGSSSTPRTVSGGEPDHILTESVPAVWRLRFDGYRLAEMGRIPGAEVRGSVPSIADSLGGWFEIEAALPVAAIWSGSGPPSSFAFDLQGIGLREGDEVRFSAVDRYSIFRPYAWGTAHRSGSVSAGSRAATRR
ncbi:MAG: hypothetical protein R3E12_12300 [Candidatus Eisenbacteria bacterium]